MRDPVITVSGHMAEMRQASSADDAREPVGEQAGEPEAEEPHSYHVHVKSPDENMLVVTPCYHVENEDGEEEIVFDHENAQEFDNPRAFDRFIRRAIPTHRLGRR